MSEEELRKMTRDRFIEITKNLDWSTIEQYVEALDDNDFWPRDFLAQALEMAKKHYVRRVVRTIKDAKGWPIIASVVSHNEAGEEVRSYKQELLFDINDYRQVIAYHQERGIYHIHMANGYVLRANDRDLGEQLHLPFPGDKATD